MEFHSLRTDYQKAKAARRTDATNHRDYAKESIARLEVLCQATYGSNLASVDPFTPTLLMAEADWAEERMPYYNLWPGIIPALTKLRLEVETQFFKLPLAPILVRFPVSGHPLTWSYEGKEWSIQTMLVCENLLRPDPKVAKRHGLNPNEWQPALSFWLDINEVIDPSMPHICRRMYKHLLKTPGWSIERCFKEIPPHDSSSEGVLYPDEVVQNCARIACALCLMAADPELAVPDVLSKDKAKFAATGDPSLIDKAHRRGKVGWDIGINVEVSPHLRSACPAALYWVGEGRKIPKIRFRKGCIVHRRRLSEVPTGFLLKNGES